MSSKMPTPQTHAHISSLRLTPTPLSQFSDGRRTLSSIPCDTCTNCDLFIVSQIPASETFLRIFYGQCLCLSFNIGFFERDLRFGRYSVHDAGTSTRNLSISSLMDSSPDCPGTLRFLNPYLWMNLWLYLTLFNPRSVLPLGCSVLMSFIISGSYSGIVPPAVSVLKQWQKKISKRLARSNIKVSSLQPARMLIHSVPLVPRSSICRMRIVRKDLSTFLGRVCKIQYMKLIQPKVKTLCSQIVRSLSRRSCSSLHVKLRLRTSRTQSAHFDPNWSTTRHRMMFSWTSDGILRIGERYSGPTCNGFDGPRWQVQEQFSWV